MNPSDQASTRHQRAVRSWLRHCALGFSCIVNYSAVVDRGARRLLHRLQTFSAGGRNNHNSKPVSKAGALTHTIRCLLSLDARPRPCAGSPESGIPCRGDKGEHAGPGKRPKGHPCLRAHEHSVFHDLDEYAVIRSRSAGEDKTMDPRLDGIVERMLDKCILDGKYLQAMGMVAELRRLDKLEGAISRCDNIHGVLSYCINLSQKYVSHLLEILGCTVKIYQTLSNLAYLCLMFLDEDETVARILDKLISGSQDDALCAYQTAFDLTENENKGFLLNVWNHLDALSSARAKPDSRPSLPNDQAADASIGPSADV